MAFKFRKSFRIAPGVRINLNAKSASVRLGPKNLGYTVSSNGGKRFSAAIPGTGLQYSHSNSPEPSPVNLASRKVAHGGKTGSRGWTALAVAIVFAIGWFSVQSDQEMSGSKSASPARVQTTPGVQPRRVGAAISEVGSYTTANVRLRQEASIDSPVVRTIPAGTLVTPSQSTGAWHHVLVGNDSGWIRGDYLKSASTEIPSRGEPTQSGDARDSISGQASIIDGDTVEIAGTRVRFNGIDAPESAQLCQDAKGKSYHCGQVAAKALGSWLAKARPLTCSFVEWDQYGRFVGDCDRADGEPVAAWLVVNGHAMDWPRHSGGAYKKQQETAQGAKSGIWKGTFQAPWEWRAQQAESELAAQPSRLMSGTCDIKGNISNSGERIYHVPGQRFYAKTAISAVRGERMFCSEEEARAAGWRPSKR